MAGAGVTAPRLVMVPPGELRLSTDPSELLYACVGSCVAVALYDPTVPLAGLLHVLLPQAGPARMSDQSEAIFADTGVPLLLARMTAAGARSERLQAALVGGASLLPEEEACAIGRRNLAAVDRALAAAGIVLRHRDDGGERGRTVELAVADGALRVTSTPVNPTAGADSVMDAERRDRVLAGLPPHAETAAALWDAAHVPVFDWPRAAAIIARDLVLTLHFFRLANSAYYGQPQGVDALETAQQRLGARQLRRLCVLLASGRQGEDPGMERAAWRDRLSHHSLACAAVAGVLAERCCPAQRPLATTAALLHSVGALAAPHAAAAAAADLPRLGASVLSSWQLPASVVAAVAGQPPGPVPALVRLACGITRQLGITAPAGCTGTAPLAPELERAGLDGSFEELLFAMYERLRRCDLLGYLYRPAGSHSDTALRAVVAGIAGPIPPENRS